MCVTNTANRRAQPVSFSANNVALSQSLLSQRLFGSFLPSAMPVKSVGNDNLNLPRNTLFTTSESEQEKTRPKRRRKPQKPGKTAKNHERHFVVHDYHDHSHDAFEYEIDDVMDDLNVRRRGGVSVAFPLKLHAVLDQVEADGLSHVVSWQGHGRAFVIHKPKEFVEHVMPFYFRQSKLTSFQRQLNLYGFARLTRGADAGGYYHELFLRGKPFLCKKMLRTKVKGTMFKAASSPEQEPDFYKMPPVVVSPHESEDEFCDGNSYIDYSCRTGYGGSYVDGYGTMSSTKSTNPTYLHELQVPTSDPAISDYSPQQSKVPATMIVTQPRIPNGMLIPSEADRILDDAVDELFLHQGQLDNLDDFIHDWDPTFEQNFEETIEDDAQLGYLLEKLLQE